MNYRWLFKMKRWVQNPPSEKRVILVLSIVAICIVVAMIEHFIGWPELLSMEPGRARWKY
ncbi:hypothetical protein [Roseovarius sp. 2305UL8-3]|uniref:hypothetical protein n=1 Tax=Roseovarius conchicola TaxID=3121636 RepID=UPI0035297B6B